MQQIPLILVDTLVPLLLKQLSKLNELGAKIANNVIALALDKKVKCNDPRVSNLKKDLQNLAKLIDAINKSLNGLSKILSALTKIGKLARIFKLVATAIPTTVPGPVSLIVTKFSDTGINCLSAVESLRNLIGSIQTEMQQISAITANAFNVIGSICNNEYFETDDNIKQQMNSLSNLNLGNNVRLSGINLNLNGNGGAGSGVGNGGAGSGVGVLPAGLPDNIFGFDKFINTGLISNSVTGNKFKSDSDGIYIDAGNFIKTYISDFYNETNVSDFDIINALNLLNDLYEQQKIEISNLISTQNNLSFKDKLINDQLIKKDPGTPEQRALLLYREFPSDVYFGKSINYGTESELYPSLTGNTGDIFLGGKPDDFFIDTENKLIYGPKESNTSWGVPIKY